MEKLYALGIFETLRAGGVVVWRKVGHSNLLTTHSDHAVSRSMPCLR